jgi:hypothetical protein
LGAAAKVRGDVGRALAVEAAVLGVVLGVVYVETTHVELISHDGDGEIGRLRSVVCVVLVVCAVESQITV